MKTLLTCDDVFDVLTRTPFTSGSSDDEIAESHLAVCHECRQLAEALRPAIGLFCKAIAEEDDSLPAYQGELSSVSVPADRVFAQVPKSRSHAAARTCPSNRQELHFWPGMAACLAIVLLTAFVMFAPRSGPRTAESGLSTSLLPVETRKGKLLAALELPSDCGTLLAPNAAAAKYDCCTKCHAVDKKVASSSRAILKSSVACVVCHDWLTEKVSQSLQFIFEREVARPKPRVVVASLFASIQRAGIPTQWTLIDPDRKAKVVVPDESVWCFVIWARRVVVDG